MHAQSMNAGEGYSGIRIIVQLCVIYKVGE